MEIPNQLAPEELEMVSQRLDSDGDMADKALEIVREFLAERKLILYGGLGLDYALRLNGGHIYPDGERPDYDMLSPQSIEDAYDLADILHDKGFPNVQALPALHAQTMRVRVNFIVVADISYAPPALFESIPYLVFDKGGAPVRFVHPDWQRMDQHQAFCFPFRDPPREPVFHRFGKDLKRFNLLAEQYALPEAPAANTTNEYTVTFPLDAECALHGDTALAVVELMYSGLKQSPPVPWMPDVVSVASNSPDSVANNSPDNGIRVLKVKQRSGRLILATCSLEPEQVLARMGYELTAKCRPLMDILPTVLVAKRVPPAADASQAIAANWKQFPEEICMFSHPGRLLASVAAASLGAFEIRMVSPQYLLMQYLMGYHAQERLKYPTALQGPTSEEYLSRYHDTLALINAGADRLAEVIRDRGGAPDGVLTSSAASLINASPFGLTTQVLGDVNYGEAQLMIAAGDVRSSQSEPHDPVLRKLMPSREELSKAPNRYTPRTASDGASKKRPHVNYDLSWFRWDGGYD